jgi:hypothetical protein
MPGQFSIVHLRLTSISGEPVALPSGLVAAEKYKGLTLPVFYSAVIPLAGEKSESAYGVSGESIVFGAKRSIAQRVGSEIANRMRSNFWW